jgi:hypothetical protein
MSDVREMPEGMSSEELDALTLGEEETVDDSAAATAEEEATLEAKEALAAVEEEDVDPKDAVIGEYRRKARDLEIEKARLEGELAARKEANVTQTEETAEKSPLELAEEAYIEENGDLDGFAMSGALYREQKAYDEKQEAIKRETEEAGHVKTTMETTAVQLQEGELSPETAGEGLDLRSMCAMGDKYLTRGDNLDLADIQAKQGTEAALKEAYGIMKRRILAAGTEDTKALQKALEAKAKTQPEPKKKTNTESDIDSLITGDDTDDGIETDAPLTERLTNFICG